MLNTKELGLIALVRTALLQEKTQPPQDFSLTQILPLIRRHQIAPMIMEALAFYDDLDVSMCMDKLLQISGLSISVTESQIEETKALCAAFEEEKIDYALLKGSVIMNYYPKPYVRSMADVDILVRVGQYDRIEPIMRRFGYEQGTESDHEYNWQKGRVHIELHKYLIPSYNKRYYAYFGDGWALMRQTENTTAYTMTDEDCFVYAFTHYAKHFRDGGIGIKHLTDLWVCKRACPNMDEKYILKGLKHLGLDEFYANVMQTASAWFDGGEMTEIAQTLTSEIISSGAYGRADSYRKAEALRNAPAAGKKSKFRWVMRKIFLPYKNMCIKYPFLRYVPILLPVMWVVRWIAAMICKPKNVKKNVHDARNMSQEAVDEYRAYLASLGLYFDNAS